jgi:hypothetical protein
MLGDETSDGMTRCNRRLGEVLTAWIASAKCAMLRSWMSDLLAGLDGRRTLGAQMHKLSNWIDRIAPRFARLELNP